VNFWLHLRTHKPFLSIRLRQNPLGIPGEQTAHPDVGQTQPELNDTLKTEATTSVGRASEAEAVDVVLGARGSGVDRGVVLAHLVGEQCRVVDTLGAGADFLPTHEHVVRVGELGVRGRGHGVGGADGERELVESVEVRVVLLEDETAEVLLLGSSVWWSAGDTTGNIVRATHVRSS
jgi:hypothetical protein